MVITAKCYQFGIWIKSGTLYRWWLLCTLSYRFIATWSVM